MDPFRGKTATEELYYTSCETQSPDDIKYRSSELQFRCDSPLNSSDG